MAVIAGVEIPASAFLLGTVLEREHVSVRLERVIPLGDRFVPYLWLSDPDLDTVEAALTAEPDVAGYRVLDSVDGDTLVRLEWSSEADGFVEALAETDASVLTGRGEAEAWTLQLRFDSHDGLTDLHRRCAREDIPVALTRVHEPGVPEDGTQRSLTDTQHETLLAALEAGYFDVPRRTNLVGLADRLGVSDTAVSERLRRGIGTLVDAALDSDGPVGDRSDHRED